MNAEYYIYNLETNQTVSAWCPLECCVLLKSACIQKHAQKMCGDVWTRDVMWKIKTECVS